MKPAVPLASELLLGTKVVGTTVTGEAPGLNVTDAFVLGDEVRGLVLVGNNVGTRVVALQ